MGWCRTADLVLGLTVGLIPTTHLEIALSGKGGLGLGRLWPQRKQQWSGHSPQSRATVDLRLRHRASLVGVGWTEMRR